jgi:predicted PhzF superfamily epimerase YddE/YHI9
MSFDLYQVDAFSERPFGGNPAAVCFCPAAPEAAWMQRVAAEMNLSETSFLVPRQDGHDLRWFTPTTEVDLCGHATLAAAHVLWETARLAASERAGFHTRSGVLTAERAGTWIALDFPATPPQAEAVELPGLACTPRWIGRSRFDVFVEVASAAEVRAARPDFAALRAVETRGVILTAAADALPYDFVSRFFSPATGIDEDPVTGSAFCALGPFWAERLGKADLLGYQASRRGGTARVVVDGERVKLYGQAVTVLRGTLLA